MADEAELPTGELETPAGAPSNPEPETELEELDPAGGDGEGEDLPTEEDLEEFDWNGRKVKGPKGLKDGVMQHADYTRKTQEVAATRKELEAQRIQQTQASEAELTHRATLHNVEAELKRFPEGYDWSAYQMHRQTDPIAADEHWNYFQHLKGQKGELSQQIASDEQARTVAAQQDIAKRLQETAEFAKTKIKGWTPETDQQVIDFAKSKGATTEDLQRMMSPMVYEMLWLARIGSQTLTKATAAPKPATATAPLTVVSSKGNPPARKSLSDMSMDEYATYRKNQMAQKGRG